MGDMAGKFSDSIGIQLHYTYGVSEIFGFDASLGYSEHSDGRYSMASALTGLRINLAWYDKIVPYVLFGPGFYRPGMQVGVNGSGEPNYMAPILFGLHVGPGVDLALTRNMFFGTALTFHTMFGASKPSGGGTLDFGSTYTSFLLHLGLTL
jgi:hypothetical protein